MAALDFPLTPTLNQTYTANGKTWKWDGTSWTTNNSESDSIFVASPAYTITSTNITNWNTAYGWGNHASLYLPLTGGTLTGNLTFSGNARRIIGDFDNATLANRTMFQTSTTNGVTDVNFLPNGTGVETYLTLNNASSTTNVSRFQMMCKAAEARIEATRLGTGTYLPINVFTSGTNRLTVATTGETIVKAALQETKTAIAASAIDLATGNYFTKTISTTTTFTVSNVPTTGTVGAFILELTNGGSATVNWFSGVKWAGGIAPTLTTSGVDVIAFYTHDGGTTWRGAVVSADSK